MSLRHLRHSSARNSWALALVSLRHLGPMIAIKETPHICVTGKSEFFMIWEVFFEWFRSMLRKNIFRRNNFQRFHKNNFDSRNNFRSIALPKIEIRRVEMILSSTKKWVFYKKKKPTLWHKYEQSRNIQGFFKIQSETCYGHRIHYWQYCQHFAPVFGVRSVFVDLSDAYFGYLAPHCHLKACTFTKETQSLRIFP